MKNVIQYRHHGALVSVREDLKGKHREHCLCYSCTDFRPGAPDHCRIAAMNYALCQLADLVLPVWECAKFLAMDYEDQPQPQESWSTTKRKGETDG